MKDKMEENFIFKLIPVLYSVSCTLNCRVHTRFDEAGDCQSVKDFGFEDSGVYNITPSGTFSVFRVYCDMITDGGGWLVFQRRLDGSTDFFRNWEEYQFGFGDVSREFWLGNYLIHIVLAQGFYELRVDLEDHSGDTRYALYKIFKLDNSANDYKLFVSAYSGDAGDGLTYHNGQAFSTKDRDSTSKGCANRFHGAWWYLSCHHSHLNGLYGSSTFGVGVNWFPWLGQEYSLKKTEMKIRRI